MKFQLIRHATFKVRINKLTFLVDPMLSSKELMEPVANAANKFMNPLVDLPLSIENILDDIDAVILTHSHRDHFDYKAIETIPKELQIFCQQEDEEMLLDLGFSKVTKIIDKEIWNGVQIARTGGQHGTGEIGNQMGPVSGFMMKTADEPTLYIVGDSIWCKEVHDALTEHFPEIIILNGGEAQFLIGDPITMGNKDIEKVSLEAPTAEIIVVHMEAWNHCLLSREELKGYIEDNHLSNITVPTNGEILEY
ncbi:MAG: MBL fold metallo-hydrolase [Bacillota bacterium]|nr:MBL fold metallo-hydrolase [Bacillota bacterium]